MLNNGLLTLKCIFIIQQNPKAGKFRNNPLENFDLLQAIFEGTLAQGKHARSNAPVERAADPSQTQTGYVDLDDDLHVRNHEDDEYFSGVRIAEDSNFPHVEISETQPSKSEGERSKKKRRGNGQALDEQIESFVEVLKSQLANETASKGATMPEVLGPLRDLLDLEVITQHQFNRAKIAFNGNPDLRTSFLDAKDVAEMVGFLDFIPGVM